jgi:hypothetical protein
MSPHCLTILAVNQQIRAEASAILYGTNHFKFSVGTRPTSRTWGTTGPSPYNTVRALPQSGISQINTCTIRIRIFWPAWNDIAELNLVKEWLYEICKLLKQGGHLREIEVESEYSVISLTRKDYNEFLKPFEGLSGLKSAIVKGFVEEAYAARLKMIMESKRKAETDNEGEVTTKSKKKRTK